MLIIIFASYIASSFKKVKRNEAIGFYHRQFAFYLVIFVLFQWVVSLGEGRHFIPLFFIIPIALFSLSEGYSRLKNTAGVIMLMFSVFQVIGWNQAFSAPRFDSHPIAKSMESRGIREFYASYWTGYPIMFLGEGRLIGSPMLLPEFCTLQIFLMVIVQKISCTGSRYQRLMTSHFTCSPRPWS
jgi:vacuolar-type H+-ATPase subunit I/STV1